MAEHVEHAYALTGHGMQGATVERATVLADVRDLSRGWSYTALSRARGQTRLLITDAPLESEERTDIAPAMGTSRADAQQTLGRIARRMRERDDEDLAIDQLPPEPPITTPTAEVTTAPPQERAATESAPAVAEPGRRALASLREQLALLRTQLQALPRQELARIEALDKRALLLTTQRDQAREQLDRIPPAPRRRLGRGEDPHLLARARLASTLNLTEQELERVLSERATAARELGEPDAVRQERDALTTRVGELDRQHTQMRNQLAEHELAASPAWATRALGQRPEGRSRAARWDRAARAIARYRVDRNLNSPTDALGAEPDDEPQRGEYRQARRALEQVRDVPELDLGVG